MPVNSPKLLNNQRVTRSMNRQNDTASKSTAKSDGTAFYAQSSKSTRRREAKSLKKSNGTCISAQPTFRKHIFKGYGYGNSKGIKPKRFKSNKLEADEELVNNKKSKELLK
jgi:hypothetical protein